MRVTILGSGDAFGSGGRFATCIRLEAPGIDMLVDLGASAMVALKRAGVALDALDAMLFTHFHGDHFGGLPFAVLEAQFVSKRKRPLTVAGPPGVAARARTTMEALFPGMADAPRAFALDFVEVAPGAPAALGPARVTAHPMRHDEAAGPCLGYRVEVGGKVFAYSGDTGWTESLVELARGADLLVLECYTWDRPLAIHLDWGTIAARLGDFAAKRIVLTHMGVEMLAHADAPLPVDRAHDGMAIEP
jgi:ribonuclease BN (tRNA processing enzyme)